MRQFIIKDIFYKILSNEKQREEMNSLKDINKAYDLFCENGYKKSFDDFKTELDDFLHSDDSLKIMNNNFDELSDEMLEGVAGGANLKRTAIRGISALMIASSLIGPVTSVGAIDDEKVSQILKNIDECDSRIRDLEKNKDIINKQTENEINKLDSEIKDREQLLGYLLKLIEKGEPQQDGANNVKRGIEDNKQKKQQISDDRNRKINNLNQQTEKEKTEKAKLEKELKEKFVLEKKKAFGVFGKYNGWLKDNKLDPASNASFEKLRSLLVQANKIAKADKFDAKEASEIVEQLGVVLKDIEKFKKDFEAKKAKKANEAREKEAKEKQEQEKEKFVLKIDNAMQEFMNYGKWLGQNGLSQKKDNLYKQLSYLLPEAREIANVAELHDKFDANAAREIVEKLDVVFKEIEDYKNEVEKEKADEAMEKEEESIDAKKFESMQKLFRHKADQAKDDLHKKDMGELLGAIKAAAKGKQEKEKEKLVLEKNNAMEELTNYVKWLNQNGLSLNYNDLHKQLLESAIKAEKIAGAAKFDAKAAREIVAKLGVVLKDIEKFKKDFEAKKAMQKLLESKANQAKDDLHKKDMSKLLGTIKAAAEEKQEQERKKFAPKMNKAAKECVDYLNWLNQNYLFPYDPEDNNLRNRLVKLSEIARQMAMAPKFDAKAAHKILEELDVVLKDVEEFKKDFEAKKEAKEKQEKEKFVLKIDNAVKEFMNYGDWLKQNGLSQEEDDNLYNQLSKLVFEASEIEKADKFDVKAARKIVAELGYAVKGVEKFKKDFEAKKKDSVEKIQSVWRGHIVRGKVKKQEKAAMNITDDKFKELLAGDQHVENKRLVKGKEWEIHNTCGVHMLTTLKNIYDYMDGKQGGPVKGFKNVIDNYLANGGTTDRLFQPNRKGELGTALNSSDFKGFLEKNKIGMQRFDFFQGINVKEEAKNANKDEWDVMQEHKDKLKNQIKSFLISYMKGKNFAPIGTVGGGHWALLAKYDEKTNKILRLDSSPEAAEWVDIDKIAGNFISSPYPLGGGYYGLNFEMPIFTRTEGIKDVQLDSDSFAEQKQNELIKKIG